MTGPRRVTSAADVTAGGRSASTQRPSFSMRIGTASYRRAIEVLEDRRGGRDRDFVLARSPAVNHTNT